MKQRDTHAEMARDTVAWVVRLVLRTQCANALRSTTSAGSDAVAWGAAAAVEL